MEEGIVVKAKFVNPKAFWFTEGHLRTTEVSSSWSFSSH